MQFIGIDLDEETIKIAILNTNKKITLLKSLKIKQLSCKENVKQLYIQSQEKKLISSSLEAQDVLIKNVPFNVKKSLFLKKAVSFQKELLTTLDPKETINNQVYDKKNSILKFFITTKELLIRHLNRLKHIHIDPDFVTCKSISMCQFSNHYFSHIDNSFLVHIDKIKTTCVFKKGLLPEKTFIIKIGSKKLDQAKQEDKITKTTNVDVLKLNPTSNLNKLLEELKNTLKNAFVSFTGSQESSYPMLITVEFEGYDNLEEFLKNDKVSSLLINEELTSNPKIKYFANSIGNALTFSSENKNAVQFRKNEFTPVKKVKNIGKKLIYTSFFMIFLSLFAYFTFSSLLESKQKILYAKLSELEKLENKYFGFEKSLVNKNFFEDLDIYETILKKQLKEFPFFLKTSNVTQTLAWLNNHKYLNGTEIIFFSYNLESCPTMITKKEPYLAKIDLEFKTTTPAIARNFYDSLIKGEGLVDNTKEITWAVGNDCYKTSFYLKTQTLKKEND